MKLDLISMDIDESEHYDFCLWYKQNIQKDPNLLNRLVLLGFNCIKYGYNEFDRNIIYETLSRENENKINYLKKSIVELEEKRSVDKQLHEDNIHQHKIIAENESKLKVELEVLRHKNLLNSELNKCQLELEKFKMMYEESLKQLNLQNSSVMLKEIERLQNEMLVKSDEINQLKRSNLGKGNKGEDLIFNIMKDSFTDCLVENIGKQGHSCDIKVTFSDGKFFVIESKYKESGVTKADISKFINDIHYLKKANCTNFLGGIFVSIKNRNIPTKSDLCFEVVDTNPVCFLGFNDENDFSNCFVYNVRIFMKLITCEFSCLNRKTLIDDMINDLVPYFEKIQNLRNNIQKIRVSVDDMDKFYNAIIKDTETIIEKFISDKQIHQKRNIRRKKG